MAARHGCDDARELAEQIGGIPRTFARLVLNGGELDTLAVLAGAPEAALAKSSPVILGRTTKAVLGGVVVGEGRFGLRRGPICPACVADDLDTRRGPDRSRPWRRFWWDIGYINTCPEHRVLLERSCRGCGAPFQPLHIIRRCRCGHEVASASTRSDDVAADEFLIARVTGGTPVSPAFMAGLELPQVGSLLLQLGRLAIRGRDGAAIDLSAPSVGQVERARLATAGLHATRDWPTNFGQVLDRLVEERPAGRAPGNAYGTWLTNWISHLGGAAGDALRAAVLAHARRNAPESNAYSLLGQRDVGGSRVNDRIGSELSGLSPRATRRILLAMGCRLDPDGVTRWVAERADVLQIGGWLARHVTRAEAMANLGLTSLHMRQLEAANLLVPGLSNEGGLGTYYNRQDLDGLVTRLRGNVVTSPAVPSGSIPFTKAAFRLGSAATVAAGIAAGEIVVAAWIGGRGAIGGICVDAGTLPAGRAAPGEPEFLTADLVGMAETRQLLSLTSFATAASLAFHGLLRLTRAYDRSSGKLVNAMYRADLEAFRTVYVTAHEMERRCPGIAHRTIRSALERHRVFPLFRRGPREQSIFLRAQAEAALMASGLSELPDPGPALAKISPG